MQTQTKPKMNKRTKRILAIGILVVIALVVGICLFFRVPTRLTAASLNRQSDLPCDFLSSPAFSGDDYYVFGGFGCKSYCSRQYENPDREGCGEVGSLNGQTGILYTTSSFPDTVIGKSRITGIECTDPEITFLGCAVGDTLSAFHTALREAGFRESGYARYEKNGIRILLTTADNGYTVACFRIITDSSNLFHIMY